MGFKTTAKVFERSQSKNGELKVLLYLAHLSNDSRDSGSAWPSQERIAMATNLTDRRVRECLVRLEKSGEIKCVGVSPYGTKNYAITLDAAPSKFAPVGITPEENDTDPGSFQQGGRKFSTESVSETSDNQSVNQSCNQKENSAGAEKFSLEGKETTPNPQSELDTKQHVNVSAGFAEWWLGYPRKECAESAARKLYESAVGKGVTPDKINAGTAAYIEFVHAEWERTMPFKRDFTSALRFLSTEGWEGDWTSGLPASKEVVERLKAIRRERVTLGQAASEHAQECATGPYSPDDQALVDAYPDEYKLICEGRRVQAA